MKVNEAIEELDNYGGHLPVIIETPDEKRYHVEIVTSNTPAGTVVILGAVGEAINDSAEFFED